ncbi:unnamed protein product [Rhodiola kirilowii]
MAPSFFCFQPEQSTVCVMDASGSLGSALVHRLLKRGYSVHAAVQNLGDAQKLKASYPGNDKLKTFHCDLFDYQSITDALRGCSGLFYTFEPPKYQPSYDEFMPDVEVRAAHNVLEACAQIDTIDKVVFTSSATAVVWRNDRSPNSPDFDERNWSDISLCRNFKLWHALSKTLAEKTAWALSMDRDVSMVSVNAGLILTDDLTINHPYLKGAAEMFDGGVLVTVELDFLVNAHICVFEDVSSYGRYLCFNKAICTAEQATEFAKLLTRGVSPPRYDHDRKAIEQRISNKKLNKLMVESVRSGPLD